VKEAEGNKQFSDFFIIWLGQVVSVFGSGLTGFALGVWVYQRTGSVTEFTLIAVFGTLPGLLLAPIAGDLVDRWDRRKVMMLGTIGAALGTVILVLLLVTGRLQIWHVYPIVALGAISMSFQVPAYMASLTTLVPKEQFGRANGMLEFGESLGRIFAPLLAGVLIASIHLAGIIVIDFITFLFALLTLLIVRIPRPQVSEVGRAASQQASFGRRLAFGWSYITARPGLAGLLAFFTLVNLLVATTLVLVTPLVLSFSTPAKLGIVLAMGGAGGLLGGLAMSLWRGPKNRIQTILALSPLLGLGLAMMGLRPYVPLVALGYFVFFVLIPIINTNHLAIWQTKVEPDLQGRVFAMRRLIFQSTTPLAFLLAGPLADHVFNPLLVENGPLANSIGTVVGTGPGRGIGLLFVTMGCVLTVTAAFGYLFPRLRQLEREVPDAVPDQAPASA
jgi:DHA3 family macrolide efflux protein-like MFS transporter